MTTRVVTVHARSSYDADTRLVCESWLQARAVRWDARRRGLRTTVQTLAPAGPGPRWWARVVRAFTDPSTFRPPGGIP